jgi:hypothetical protein
MGLRLAEIGRSSGSVGQGTAAGWAIGEDLHSSERKAMAQAGLVLDWRRELLHEVAAGALALDSAYQSTRDTRDLAEAEQRQAAGA